MSHALGNHAFFKAAHFSKLLFVCATALCGLLGAPSATAQTPQLVKDLETRWKLLPCAQGVALGEYYVFAAGSGDRCALHVVDRSFSEPTRLTDFGPYALRQIGSVAVFLGCVDTVCTLYASSGPPSSLQQLFPKTSSLGNIQRQDLTLLQRVGNRLIFRVCDGSNCVLWSTDGSTAGTLPLHPASANLGPERAPGFNTLWFTANSGQGAEWWNTDGTPAGTSRVGPVVAYSSFGGNDTALFSISNTSPQTLFRLQKGSFPQPQEPLPTPLSQPSIGMLHIAGVTATRVILRGEGIAERRLFGADATGAPPVEVASGVFGSWYILQRTPLYTVVTSCGNSGCKTWRTDGTPAGSALLFDETLGGARAGSAGSVVIDNETLLSPSDQVGAEGLYAVTGNTKLKLFAGVAGRPLVKDRNNVFFCPVVAASSPDFGTWISDGTPVGTRKLLPSCVSAKSIDSSDINQPVLWGTNLVSGINTFDLQSGARKALTSSDSRGISIYDHAGFDDARAAFFWCAFDGCRLERTDGSAAGTYPVSSGEYLPVTSSGGLVQSTAMTNVAGTVFSLRNTSGAMVLATLRDQAGTGLNDVKTFARTLSSGGGRWPGSNTLFMSLGNKVYFALCLTSAAGECGLWSTDGTPGGTTLVMPLPITTTAFIADLVPFRGGLAFNWCDDWSFNKCKLGFSDGTVGGTRLLDFNPADAIVPVGDHVWFVHMDGTQNWRMMRSDGTVAGTLVVPEFADLSFSYEHPVVPLRDGYVVAGGFSGNQPDGRKVLFYKPGSTPIPLAGFNGQFTIRPFAVTHAGRFVFAAGDWRTSINELWSTDGSAIGTRKIDEQVTVSTSPRESRPHLLRIGNSILYQRCLEDANRCEIRSTNAAGTEVSTLVGAPFSALYGKPAPLRALGGRLLFEGDNGKSGRELWIVDVPQPLDADGDGIPDALEASAGTNALLPDNNIFGNARLFAMQQARDFFGREATAGEITTMVNAIASGTTRSALIEQMLNTPEHFDLYGPILRLYQAYFLRPSDIGGLNFWVTQYKTRPASGWSFEGISEFFSLSQEFKDRYGALNNNQFVTLIYNNVLNRAPDTGGLAFWVDELDKGRRIRGNVMAGFSESPENKGKTKGEVQVATLYAVMLKQDIDPTVYAEWVPRINAGQSIRPLIDQLFAKPEYRARFLP